MKNVTTLFFNNYRRIKNYAIVYLVLSLGLSFTSTAFLMIKDQYESQKKIEFSWVVHNRNRLIKQAMETVLEPVKVIRDYLQTSNNVTRKQFSLIAEPLLSRNSSFEMIGLIYNNIQNDKSTTIQSNGLSLKKQLNPLYTLIYAENRRNINYKSGYNLSSQPVLIDAMNRAGKTGMMTISGRIKLLRGNTSKYGVMVYLPLFKNTPDFTKTQKKHKQLIGFLVAILRLNDLAHIAIGHLEQRGVVLLILDESAKKEFKFLEFYASRLKPKKGVNEQQVLKLVSGAKTKITEIVQMADRKWSITAIPNAKFRSAEAFEHGAWVVLAGGIILTLLVSIYLLRMKINMQERLQISLQLKEREELFWQMTETVNDVFWAISADRHQFLYVSPAFEAIWGHSCEALYNNSKLYTDHIHPDDNSYWFKSVEKAIKQFTEVEIIYRIIRLNGSQRWLRDNIFPVSDLSGKVYRLVGVTEDITEKKQTDDALLDSENKLRTLFNQSPDIIMTVNKAGMILLINHGITLEFSGRRSDNRHSSYLLPPNYRKDYNQLLANAFHDGKVNYLPYQAKDSTWWEVRIVPIVEKGEVLSSMVIFTDITEKRNFQLQAIHNERLASLGVIATGVAHDINNPNNAIQTGASVFSHVWKDAMKVLKEYYQDQGDFSLGGLSFAEDGESLVELITGIKENSRHIEAIVSNLKHLGKSNQANLNEKVDINLALTAATRVLGSNISKYTNNWEIKLAKDLPLIKGNLQQLEQVFINVIHNALYSLPDKEHGVRVESSIDSEQKLLLIRVIDQGSGILEDDLLKVTEPFFTTRLETGGTGLGLSISKTIIENHKGSITFESSKDVGTLVTIQLPLT